MTDAVSLANRFVAAAQKGELDAMNAMVDWTLSSAGELARALRDLPAEEREEQARRGLASLGALPGTAAESHAPAGTLPLRLQRSPGARSASADERDRALAHLRVEPVREGLTRQTAAVLDDLGQRAAALENVAVIDRDDGRQAALVTAPDGQRGALVRRLAAAGEDGRAIEGGG